MSGNMAPYPDEEDETPDAPAPIDTLEVLRRHALRTFRIFSHLDITDMTKSVSLDVEGHFWENQNPAGHANFYQILQSGRNVITHSIAAGEWKHVVELPKPYDTDRAMVEYEQARTTAGRLAAMRGRVVLGGTSKRRAPITKHEVH